MYCIFIFKVPGIAEKMDQELQFKPVFVYIRGCMSHMIRKIPLESALPFLNHLEIVEGFKKICFSR